LVLIFSTTFSPLFVLIANLLWHPWSMTKKNTMITMWDIMEYANHTHYTQFFWHVNWNFKQVTWTWNQFIFHLKIIILNKQFTL
jgi:hypothetical protein